MDKAGDAVIRAMQDLSRVSTNGYAKIRVNENLCDPQTFKSLFDHFSRGTILDRIELDVEPLQTKVSCGECGYESNIRQEHAGYQRCPDCGRFAEIQDNAYELVAPDPTRAGMRKSIRF